MEHFLMGSEQRDAPLKIVRKYNVFVSEYILAMIAGYVS